MSRETSHAMLPPPDSGWRHWLRTENLGLGLTLGYLFLTALGMFHRALVFLLFRINILDYAEPSDFLLAALRDPLITIACDVPIPRSLCTSREPTGCKSDRRKPIGSTAVRSAAHSPTVVSAHGGAVGARRVTALCEECGG